MPDAPRVGSLRCDTSGASHATNGVIGSITKHPYLYKAPPSMPPHFGNTPSVSQPGYTPEFSRTVTQSRATPSYVSPAHVPHVHGLNFLAPTCNGQIVGFASFPATLTYYPPHVPPTLAPIPTLCIP